MNTKAMILGFVVAAAFAALPAVLAAVPPSGTIPVGSGPNATPCNPIANPHTYGNAGVVGDSRDGQADAAGGAEQAEDGCNANIAISYDTSQAGDPFVDLNCVLLNPCPVVGNTGGDGDPDVGVGGGAFPASDCVIAPSIAHHAFAPGSTYYISSALPLVPAALSVGTDGGSADGACSGGNAIVSNDPVTDPFDCGAGVIGLSTPMIGATIAPNQPSNSCTPSGGIVAAFTQTGPILVDNGHCQVHTHLTDDIADPTNPTVVTPTFDVSGCNTITLQTIAVSIQGFIGDAGF